VIESGQKWRACLHILIDVLVKTDNIYIAESYIYRTGGMQHLQVNYPEFLGSASPTARKRPQLTPDQYASSWKRGPSHRTLTRRKEYGAG